MQRHLPAFYKVAKQCDNAPLRWLETVSQYFSRLSLMGHYNHSIPVDANIMVSINCAIIGEQVAVNFVAQ